MMTRQGVLFGNAAAKSSCAASSIRPASSSTCGSRRCAGSTGCKAAAPWIAASAQLNWLGDDSGLTLRADYALLAKFFHEPGEADAIYGGAVSLSKEPSYGLLDLRAAYEIGDFRVTAYVTNVTKKDYRRTVLALGSTLSDFPGEPRTYGLKVGYRF